MSPENSLILVENAWEHWMFTTMQKKGQFILKTHGWLYSIRTDAFSQDLNDFFS